MLPYLTDIVQPALLTLTLRQLALPANLRLALERPGRVPQVGERAVDTGFQHIVLGLPAPYPANVTQWVTDELITPMNVASHADVPPTIVVTNGVDPLRDVGHA
jgi:acetyl esterase/lipase